MKTPLDLATTVAVPSQSSSTHPQGWSTQATYCFGQPGQGQIPDDQRSWD